MVGSRLRIAVIAGTLGLGGAEKQLFFICRALVKAGCDIRVVAFRDGEHYKALLEAAGVPTLTLAPSWGALGRAWDCRRAIQEFRPHVIHAAHFYTGVHGWLAARGLGTLVSGSLRNDGFHEMQQNRLWAPLLLHLPDLLIANSERAIENLSANRRLAGKLCHLPNVIDLAEFDKTSGENGPRIQSAGVTAVAVGRLVPAKRFDRFVEALARARGRCPCLRGLLIGDGPERERLASQALELGLRSDALEFAGQRTDIPQILTLCDMLVLTSEQEGFPNVLLEAMAARLPTVTTPAGDAGRVVVGGVTGYVVPGDDSQALAQRLEALALQPGLRERMGRAGRERVEKNYTCAGLAERFLQLLFDGARRSDRREAVAALERVLAS